MSPRAAPSVPAVKTRRKRPTRIFEDVFTARTNEFEEYKQRKAREEASKSPEPEAVGEAVEEKKISKVVCSCIAARSPWKVDWTILSMRTTFVRLDVANWI